MSEARNKPSGYTENVTVIGLFGLLGNYVAGLVSDPNLTGAIIIAFSIGGKMLQTYAANALGDTVFGSVFGGGK